jgi:hypothetical protein
MNKVISIISPIAIMVLVNVVPSALAVSSNDTTTTPPLTPGYHIWHGTRYAVCPPGVPAPCANYLPNDFNNTFWKTWGGVPFISGPDTK